MKRISFGGLVAMGVAVLVTATLTYSDTTWAARKIPNKTTEKKRPIKPTVSKNKLARTC